ncbi:MAG: long-chain fatty acid--CoA ligase, partial [Candidatus Neomarinimicrobiota bacterium]
IDFIMSHSGSKAIVVSSKVQAEKIIKIKNDLKKLRYMIVLDDTDLDEDWILSWKDVLVKGELEKKESKITLPEIVEKIKAEDLFSIIYTSGTSGNPKGVMISQFNMATNVQQSQAAIGFKPNKRWLSFLPLSHSFERVTSLFSLWIGAEIYFAESISKVAENLKEVKPQYMTTVPRLLEKVYSTVQEQVALGSQTKQNVFHWAQNIGHLVVSKYLSRNQKPRGILAVRYKLAKRLVFYKIYNVFGGEFIQCVSGGAPLSEEVGEFLLAAGIGIMEGYGLTEMSPVTHVNTPEHIKFGTVGKALPDVQTKIAEDGEILLNGPNRMEKYYKNPEETAESIDKDGWFHTGDIGFVDEEGFLKITDRKKNIIVTAGGKNIAPAAVEREIMASKFVEQALVIGDRRKYLTTIIVPAVDMIKKWGEMQNPSIKFKDYDDIASSDAVQKLLKSELDAHQEGLARYEQIKYFFIAPQPFTIETGELTASMKVKRDAILKKYSREIDKMYDN